ncbi:MAG: topoisomerase (poxvirus type) [Actinomycetia bacterium]|nr:topoisomerase (poxvirus type) [Actinomycetes bacterium]
MTSRSKSSDPDVPSSLYYVDDSGPGYGRRRSGKGFSYTKPDGSRLSDPAELARIRALAIPPAWTRVWICPRADGHIQATGRDAKGRKQYRYHPAWRAARDEDKYTHLIDFGTALPGLRRQISRDLASPGITHDKVVATVVHLLETTLIRIGNEQYARTNGSFGLTTLRGRQVKVRGDAVHFSFKGKSGQWHEVETHDKRVAQVIRRCQHLKGQRLFQYTDDAGAHRTVESSDVNRYLHRTMGDEFTAKDFRTWMGTLMAATALVVVEPPRSDAAARRTAAAAIEVVARHLGNTPTVARTSYVHPDVVDLYAAGDLAGIWSEKHERDGRYLLAEEKRLLRVLRVARRRQRASTRRAASSSAKARARAA